MIDHILDKNAHALRVCRLLKSKDEIRYYEPITFPKDPYKGCELYLRRCEVFGYILTNSSSPYLIDVFDKEGDIIQDFEISKNGFKYLQKELKFKIDKELMNIGSWESKNDR
jgi:hypothetical protein